MLNKSLSKFFFTVRKLKIVLTKDHPKLGFAGETVHVKPGYASNYLIPNKIAKYGIDKHIAAVQQNIDMEELERKQKKRLLDLYIDKLKKMKCTFTCKVSQLNKSIIEEPISNEDIIEFVEINHGIKLSPDKLQLGHKIDSIGEHIIRANYYISILILSMMFTISMKFKKQNLVTAINCGSNSEETDSYGIVYKKDQNYSTGGVPSQFGCAQKQYWITADADIYCSEKYGDNDDLVYKIPIKAHGRYVVNLKFSQVVFFSPGQKVFDIGIGDSKVLKDLDIFDAVGSYEPIDLFIELEISFKYQVTIFSVTDSKTHVFEKPFIATNGYDKESKKLVIKLLKGKADNPKINAIVITKGLLEDSTLQNYVHMKNQIMKDKQAILARRQKRQELDSGEYSLKEPFDGERESQYEMDHMKSIFNQLLQVPYLVEALMFLFVVGFFYFINKLPDNERN